MGGGKRGGEKRRTTGSGREERGREINLRQGSSCGAKNRRKL